MEIDREWRPTSVQNGMSTTGTRRCADPSDNAASLPPDFEWRPYLTGPALYLGPRLIAHASALDRGAGFRVAINPDSINRRYVFLPDQAHARRYVETWATKYQDRLRAGE